jgi:hypothetical protein
MKTILCAAIHFQDNIFHKNRPKNIQNGFVICGYRHHNCIEILKLILGEELKINRANCIQGFLTSDNEFVSRQDAAKIALASGQIKEEIETLISEDLY